VQLVIIDINDNAPSFSQERLSIALSELTPPKDLFPLMPATDIDSPANGVAGYRLTVLESTEPNPWFDVRVTNINDTTSATPQLRLVLKQSLDHETADQHHLRVLAYDRGSPYLTGTLYIDVTVEDANDNAPKFDKELYATVLLETAPRDTTVITVTAIDLDSGANGRVSYRFTARTQAAYGHQFSVDSSTGDISLLTDARKLERAEYVLGVVAEDGGEQPGVTGVSVSVVMVTGVQCVMAVVSRVSRGSAFRSSWSTSTNTHLSLRWTRLTSERRAAVTAASWNSLNIVLPIRLSLCCRSPMKTAVITGGSRVE